VITDKLLIAAYALLLALPPALALGFGDARTEEFNLLEDLGKVFALMGVTILLLQPILAARIKWLERPFGQDMLIRFHRNMAVVALGLLASHPLLIAAGEDKWFILYSIDLPWYVFAGRAALLFTFFTVAGSLAFRKLPLSFERWRLVHGLAAPLTFLLFMSHVMVISDNVRQSPIVVILPALFAVSVAVLLWHRVLRPARLAREAWSVKAVAPEARDVTSITLAPYPGAGFSHLPGQFAFVTLMRGRGLPVEEHHFTISSPPGPDKAIRMTIKASGDFTRTIRQTRPGDLAAVDGPYGRFSHVLHPDEKRLVFIAAGIGITPIMGMLASMRQAGAFRPSTLIYANREEQDIALRSELDELAEELPGLKLVHVLSRPVDGWTGEKGRIGPELIKRHAFPITPDTGWYLCGPEAMTNSVMATLSAMGVARERMHREIFHFI